MNAVNPVLELEQRTQLNPGWGGRAAIEDLALQAYQRALDAGLGKQEAEKLYFETFKNSLKRTTPKGWV